MFAVRIRGGAPLLPSPLPRRIQVYGCLVACFSDSANRSNESSNRLLKESSVEARKVRTAGSGGGGGHDTATGTVGCEAQPGNSTIEISSRSRIFSIGGILSLLVGKSLGCGGFLSGYS